MRTVVGVKKYLPLIVVLLIEVILLTVSYTPVPFWDGTLYYGDFLSIFNRITGPEKLSLHDVIYGFRLGTHAGHSIVAVAFPGQFFAGWKGVYIVQSLLILLADFCLYRIVRFMFPDLSEILSAISVSVFAFSPYICGLGYEFGPYLYCSLYVIFVLYFYFVKKNYCLTGVFLLAVYLSLETGIIIVGSLIGTHIIYELVKCDGKSFADRLKNVLPLKKFIPLLVPELFLLIPGVWYYPGYSETTGSGMINNFGFRIDNTTLHLKQTFVSNFFWCFWILFMIAIYLWNRKMPKVKCDRSSLISCGVSFAVYVLFICVFFISTPCPRYNQLVVFFYSIIAAFAFSLLKATKVNHTEIAAFVIPILLIVQNFTSIDPTYLGTYSIDLNDKGSTVYSPSMSIEVLDVTTCYHNELYAYSHQSAYGVYLLNDILKFYDYDENTVFLTHFYIYNDVLGAGAIKWDVENKQLVMGNDESYLDFKCLEYDELATIHSDKCLLILPYMMEIDEVSGIRDGVLANYSLIDRREFSNFNGTYYVYFFEC